VARLRFVVARSDVASLSNIDLLGGMLVDSKMGEQGLARGSVPLGRQLAREAVVAGEDGRELRIPSPMRFGSALRLNLDAECHAMVGVYDVHGRLVRLLTEGALPAGVHELRWDGRAAGGRTMATGVYFVRAKLGNRTLHRTVLFVR
jgi:hypothetical protein